MAWGSERCRGDQKKVQEVRQVDLGQLQVSTQGQKSSVGPTGAKIDHIELGRPLMAGAHKTKTWSHLGS